MSDTNQQPFAGIAGSPSGIVLVKTANFMILNSGSPVNVIAGQSGNASTPPDMVWDYVNAVLWICTISGSTPASTTWSQINIVGSGQFTNIIASGSLTIGGTTSLGATLAVTGAATLNSTLGVTGAATFASSVNGVTPASGDSSTAMATTAFVNTLSTPAQASYDGIGRNKLHNPKFTVQQRGTGPWTTNSYTADQWLLGVTGDSDSVSIPTLSDTDRAAIGDEDAAYALLNIFTGASSAGDYSTVAQRIEGVRRLSGKTCTLSFWARASSGTPKIGLMCIQNFGTGGSPSASVNTQIGVTPALSSTWTYYHFTFNVPSASGKTFGSTAGTDFTSINFFLSDYSNTYGTGIGVQSGDVYLWGAQLEIGSIATPLEKREPQTELALCQRYYTVFSSILICGYDTSSNVIYNDTTLPVTMRASPTVTYVSPTYFNSSLVSGNAQSPTDVRTQLTITTTGLGYVSCAMTCSAEL